MSVSNEFVYFTTYIKFVTSKRKFEFMYVSLPTVDYVWRIT